MSQNQEIIEAKLCGYIDGELDAEGRAEIEKHLEANPQHRRLLESLKATRDLLKWLPREAAPPEVAETLNGQLERSVLLDDEPDSLRPGIWPRVFAAAAIVLLTAGLGVAVYFTLPKSEKNATPYASRGGESAGPSASEVAPIQAERSDKALARREVDRTALKSVEPEVLSKATGEVEEKKPELERLALEAVQNRATIVAAANGINTPALANASRPVPTSNVMVMLVRSNSPQDAGKQITSYMDSQKIGWKLAKSDDEAAPQVPQNAAPMRQSRWAQQQATTQQTLADAAAAPRILAQQEEGQMPAAPRPPATQPWQFEQTNAGPATNQAAAGMYVARMSREQAVQLTNTISQEGAQKAELKELEAPALTTSPAFSTTNPSRDEQLAMRPFGGLDQLERKSGGQPTTRPAASAVIAKDSEPTPTTQPAPVAAPNQPLDVVIVVQSSVNAPVATQPATQPTTAPIDSSVPATQPAGTGQQ